MDNSGPEQVLRCILKASEQKSNALKVQTLAKGLTHPAIAVELREFLHQVLDPSYNYYMTRATIPQPTAHWIAGSMYNNDMSGLLVLLTGMHNRVHSGKELKKVVEQFLFDASSELRWLFRLAIERKLPGNIGRTIVNKAAPRLVYKQPYGGCASWDADMVNKRFNWAEGVMWQVKEDGMTLLVDTTSHEIRTRSGQDVSVQLAEHFKPLFYTFEPGYVVHFEAKLWDANFDALMPRPEANGIYNAIFKSEKAVYTERIVLVGLDMIPRATFYGEVKGKMSCNDRYARLIESSCAYNVAHNDINSCGWPSVSAVEMVKVTSLAAARALTQEEIAEGREGGVLKDPKAEWTPSKMRSQMKMKNEFECTLVVVGYNPHKKHKEWVGSLLVESSDGVIKTGVGSGLNETSGSPLDRRNPEHFPDGLVVEVKAEKISKKNALDLPRIIEPRFDKDVADTYEEVLGAYNDSISLKE